MNGIKNSYSFSDKIRMAWWLARTKLIDKRARLFRFPLVIRGRQYIDFGERLTMGVGCRFDCFNEKRDKIVLRFGRNVQINDHVHIVAMDSIRIGDNVLMASHVFISDNSHGSYKGGTEDSDPRTPPMEREYATSPITIGDNVWLGEGVVVMPGVTIGNGCVVGAHSIVNKSLPDNTIAVGAPARVIKRYSFETKHWERV